jgi:hypothetical protein
LWSADSAPFDDAPAHDERPGLPAAHQGHWFGCKAWCDLQRCTERKNEQDCSAPSRHPLVPYWWPAAFNYRKCKNPNPGVGTAGFTSISALQTYGSMTVARFDT